MFRARMIENQMNDTCLSIILPQKLFIAHFQYQLFHARVNGFFFFFLPQIYLTYLSMQQFFLYF